MGIASKSDEGLDIVREEFRAAFNSWHLCRLSKKEAKVRNKNDQAPLCDICEELIQTHMANIRRKMRV